MGLLPSLPHGIVRNLPGALRRRYGHADPLHIGTIIGLEHSRGTEHPSIKPYHLLLEFERQVLFHDGPHPDLTSVRSLGVYLANGEPGNKQKVGEQPAIDGRTDEPGPVLAKMVDVVWPLPIDIGHPRLRILE